jgi:hypothetical protein
MREDKFAHNYSRAAVLVPGIADPEVRIDVVMVVVG